MKRGPGRPRKYHTESERQEAKRRYRRDAYARLKASPQRGKKYLTTQRAYYATHQEYWAEWAMERHQWLGPRVKARALQIAAQFETLPSETHRAFFAHLIVLTAAGDPFMTRVIDHPALDYEWLGLYVAV